MCRKAKRKPRKLPPLQTMVPNLPGYEVTFKMYTSALKDNDSASEGKKKQIRLRDCAILSKLFIYGYGHAIRN